MIFCPHPAGRFGPVKSASASFPGLGYRLPLWSGVAGRQSVGLGGASVAHHSQQPVGSDRLILVSIAGCMGNESVIQLK